MQDVFNFHNFDNNNLIAIDLSKETIEEMHVDDDNGSIITLKSYFDNSIRSIKVKESLPEIIILTDY
jgi:hypothetical protein